MNPTSATEERRDGPGLRDLVRRPDVVITAATTSAVWALLVLKNRSLFSRVVIEQGDQAANSLLIEQAKHFELLHGHYSRVGFNHPGPGFLYLQAAGEWLFHDVLGVVPTPFNGQVLASLALNALCIGLVAAVLYSWTNDLRVPVLAAAVAVAFLGASDPALVSAWMPFMFIAPFLLLMVSCASVAAGRWNHLWLVALAGGLLVHGHVEFVLFVPVLTVLAIGIGLVVTNAGLRASVRSAAGAWMAFAAVIALFVAPIALNLALNYPEPVQSYLDYTRENDSPAHSWSNAASWALQFLEGGIATDVFWPIFAAGVVGVGIVTTPAPLRRSLVAVLAMAATAFALLVLYAKVGVDDLGEVYIGYFAWAIPLLLAMAAASTLLIQVPRNLAASVGSALVALALLGPAVHGAELVNPEHGDATLAEAADAMLRERRDDGQAVAVAIEHATWPDAVGVLLDMRRHGHRGCVIGNKWRVLMTSDLVCTPSERAEGLRLVVVTTARAKSLRPDRIVARTSDAVVARPA